MKAIHSIFFHKGLAVLLLAGLTTASCKKLIEIPSNPPTQIPVDQVFADSLDIMSAIAGNYIKFGATGGSTISNGMITQYTGLTGDELVYNQPSNTPIMQLYTNSLVASNATVAAMWTSAYSSIYAINSSIIGITPSKGIGDSAKQQLLGELKVMRAFYYFYLVNIYGGVPLVTGKDFVVNEALPRASVDSVYGLILSDLTSARTTLKAAYPSANHARINLYTADALLAKVYLYRKDYVNAANMASEVINSGKYSLVADLTKVFLDGSAEGIWQLPANGTTTQTPEASAFIPFSTFSAPNYSMTTSLLAAFETGDARKTSWLNSQTTGGKLYNYPYKYKNKTSTATPLEGYMMFRLGELYLNRAEALANQGKTDSALADMNKTRVRAGLNAITSVASADELMADIMHERQVELFCEWGSRWFDLKRTGTIDAVLGAEKAGWQSFDALFPINSDQLLGNQNLTQNPGY